MGAGSDARAAEGGCIAARRPAVPAWRGLDAGGCAVAGAAAASAAGGASCCWRGGDGFSGAAGGGGSSAASAAGRDADFTAAAPRVPSALVRRDDRWRGLDADAGANAAESAAASAAGGGSCC